MVGAFLCPPLRGWLDGVSAAASTSEINLAFAFWCVRVSGGIWGSNDLGTTGRHIQWIPIDRTTDGLRIG